VRQLICAAGAKRIFLPKFSSDLSPIEQGVAKLKHLLRKAAARIVETICVAIAQLLGCFTRTSANYKNAGYALKPNAPRLSTTTGVPILTLSWSSITSSLVMRMQPEEIATPMYSG
jgi:hypothetical protein